MSRSALAGEAERRLLSEIAGAEGEGEMKVVVLIYSLSVQDLIKAGLLVPPQKLVKMWSVISLARSADNVDFVKLPAVYQLLRPCDCQLSIRVPSRYDLST